MISFSLQRNKLWGGTGFLIKNSSLELSSLCFANQDVILTPAKYKVKVIGSSISGNGIFSFLILNSENEIFSKKILFSGKNNTEISFDIEINTPGKYTIKIQRNKDSIGRILINLLTITKEIEVISPNIKNQIIKELILKEKTFVIIDYDTLNNFNFFNLFTSINNKSNFFFLIKTNQSYLSKDKDLNFKMFFEWEDLFDYLSLYDSKSILYLENNIDKSLFSTYNMKISDVSEIKNNNKDTKTISGILF
jgi:hypothetical protein